MSSPEDPFAALPLAWRFRPFPNPGDPIDMEFIIRDLEPAVRNKLVAARLDAISKVYVNMAEAHRNVADAAANMSKILAGKVGK